MPGVGACGSNLTAAETEEFLAAVARQSIGRLCVVRPSKNLVGSTERRVDGLKASVYPTVRSTGYVNRGGAPLGSILNNQAISLGKTTGKAENKMMMAETRSLTMGYARPSNPEPSSSRQMAIARTTLSSSVIPLRPKPAQQPRAIPTVATMPIPTATTASHRLVPVERTCQAQLPLAAPLRDLADRWARELDAARQRRKELKRQFQRDFRFGYGGRP